MAYRGVVDDVRYAVGFERPGRLPVFACSEEFDVRWYGRYTYEELCQDGQKMAEVWIAAVEEFDYDWAWFQVDDCFEFEPLGVGCHGHENILRATRDYLPAARKTLDKLTLPDPQRDGRMPEKLKAIRLTREHFGDDVLVVGSCAAPYSCAGLLYGLGEAMLLLKGEPLLLADTCEFFVDMQRRWVEAQVEAGAHAIWLGDCNAFSGLISVDQYRLFALPSCRRLIEHIRQAGALTILHNSEIKVPYLLAECDVLPDVINCGPAADIAAAGQALRKRCCYSGNLDPIAVLQRGTPEQVEAEAERIATLCYPDGGYVFCTGEMVPRETPVDNMKAMIRGARNAGRRLMG